MNNEPIYTDVVNCSRCGKNHQGMGFQKLKRPVVVGSTTLSYWGTCPQTFEPLLLTSNGNEEAPATPLNAAKGETK